MLSQEGNREKYYHKLDIIIRQLTRIADALNDEDELCREEE